jgi:hypothetical protein
MNRPGDSWQWSAMLKLSDVLTCLLEWHDRQTPLRILLSTPDGKFAFDCTLVRFFDTGISVQLAGDSDLVDLNLTGYDFEALHEGTAEPAHEELSGNGRGLKAKSSDRTLLILEMISVSS